MLPDAVRERVGDVEDAVTLEAGRWTVATDPATVLTVAASIRARRTVRFRYTTHDGAVSERSVEPYGLVHLDGRWYLVGHCRMRRALRTFRLDRVTDVVEPFAAMRLGLGRPLRVHGPQALRDAFAVLAGRASAAAR